MFCIFVFLLFEIMSFQSVGQNWGLDVTEVVKIDKKQKMLPQHLLQNFSTHRGWNHFKKAILRVFSGTS